MSSASQKPAAPGPSAASAGTALPPGFPPSLSKAGGASLKASSSCGTLEFAARSGSAHASCSDLGPLPLSLSAPDDALVGRKHRELPHK